MNEKLERIKNHIYDNRKVYLAATVGVVVGVVTVLVVIAIKSKTGFESPEIVQKINQIAWRPENNQVVINLIERSTPSKPVHLVGTNLYWSSLSEAARETGYELSLISKNVNGHIPDVKGNVFELLEHA